MPVAKMKWRVKATLTSMSDDPLTILSDPLNFVEAEGERAKLEVRGFQAVIEQVIPEKKKKKVNYKLLQTKLFPEGQEQTEMHGSE